MAKQPGLDFQSAKGGLGELKRRLLFVVGALIVFRIGSFIPIPGIDAAVLAKLLEQQRGTIIEMFNMFSGGALSRASIFALGIMPYISASIIVQLLTVVYQPLAELKKEGESGRRKISQYTRYGTLVLAIFQSIGIATGLPNMPGMQGLVINPGFAFYFTAVVSLVTGTMFLMWLGEQITERGIPPRPRWLWLHQPASYDHHAGCPSSGPARYACLPDADGGYADAAAARIL